MTSMVVCDASVETMVAMFGAKAVVSRLEMRRGCHVTVIESGKFLRSRQWVVVRSQTGHLLVFPDQDIFARADAQLQPALDQLLLADRAEPIGIAYTAMVSHSYIQIAGMGYTLPLLRHSIFTWFPCSGRVRTSSVGAKNMASSSGCAMSSRMRLLRSVGNDAARVLVYIQKAASTRGTEAQAIQFILTRCSGSGPRPLHDLWLLGRAYRCA